jgi:hypothetical protein
VSRPVIVPIHLGCCPDEPRCVICPPPPPFPATETLLALGDHYRDERAGGEPVVYGFFGGPPPSDALLDAIPGVPFTVRVRPDLLSRARAGELVARGCTGIELDALTFDDGVLRASGRRYRGALVRKVAEGIADLGVRVGLVLVPGLPGSTFDAGIADADAAIETADAVRLHPALVIEHSRLAKLHRDGAYRVLELADAVAVCRAMMDRLESAGVEVIRVGLQPGPDGAGRAIAGPLHSSLRELVEARRVLDVLRGMLDGTPIGVQIEIRCAPADETRTRGPLNQHVRTLRAEYGLGDVKVSVDPELSRGMWEIGVRESA